MFGFDDADGFDYQGNIIRPPSEADSILIQVTLGCSHHTCTFCNAYLDKRFAIKPREIVDRDIALAARYCHYQNRVFLMDGDALILPQSELVHILTSIRTQLPWVERVGLYANAKSVRLKSDAELRELAGLGLGIAYMGVESGDDETLRKVRKGSTAAQLLDAGRRLQAAGILTSVTVLLGIAGKERSLIHARLTGELLTAMDPDYVGILSLVIKARTELERQMLAGEFVMPEPMELLREQREMLASMNLSHGLVRSNHAYNSLPLKIAYPEGKAEALRLMDAALEGRVPLRHVRPEWYREW